jgi:hypothetical protein
MRKRTRAVFPSLQQEIAECNPERKDVADRSASISMHIFSQKTQIMVAGVCLLVTKFIKVNDTFTLNPSRTHYDYAVGLATDS